MIFGNVDICNCEGCYLAHSLHTHQGRIGKGTLITADVATQLADSGFTSAVVARLEAGDIHEDEAALSVARNLGGNGVTLSKARTGRVNLLAATTGLCHFDAYAITAANAVDEGITMATLPENLWVAQGRMVATVKIIPYAVSEKSLVQVLDILAEITVSVTPVVPHKAELIQTRLPSIRERVLDKTRRITEDRLSPRSVKLMRESRCEHTVEDLVSVINEACLRKPDWLLIVGASAISDRADVIPQGVIAAGGEIDRYGIPADPGNLLLLGHIVGPGSGNGSGDESDTGFITRIIGLPGCARSPRYNGLDMIIDRMACEVPVTNKWLSGLSVGGLLAEIADRPAPRIESTDHRTVGAVILAAGSSRRAGSINKLLVPFGKSAMVAHVAQVVSSSHADRVIAVTGFDQAPVVDALSATAVECHYNGAHASGMASSVVTGVSQLTDTDAVLICLGDMPHVTPDVINQLISAFKNNSDKSIFIPVSDNRRGNPVLIGKVFFDALLTLEGDAGARQLIQQYPDEVYEVELEDTGVLVDYDTEAELERLVSP